MTTNFVKPGTRKTPDFLSSLWPTLTIHSMTAFTSFCPVRCPQRSSQSTEISSSALACCLLCSISQSIQTENSECPHLPFDARAEPLPELKGLLLLALTLGLNLFLRGFLSHSSLIMLSRKPAAPLIPSDSGTGVPALQAEYTRNLLVPQINMVCDAERDVMEHCETVLRRRDVGSPDHLAPLLGFVGKKLSELGRRARENRAAKVGNARLDLGIAESRVDLPIELVDNLRRNVLWRADTEQRNRLITRHEFADGRNIRQHFRPRRGGDRQSPQLAGSQILNRSSHPYKANLHVSGEQVSQCGSGAAIRNVNEVDARHHLEQFARQVRYGAVACRGHINLAWIGFGVGDQFNECLGRKRRICQHDLRLPRNACDRRDIADEIETEFWVERRIDRFRRTDHQERITVGGRPYDRLSRDVGPCAWTVLDNERLTKTLR